MACSNCAITEKTLMTFSPGDNVGPYRIIEPLGQGGMATVFKGYHAALDRYVAIKVLHPAFKEDPNFLARFHREARIVAKLDHPNIVPIYDFAEHAEMPYLVMRYVEGKTLKAILRDGRLPIERVLAITRPVTDGLAYAHAQGVLHRDVKPSNILCANDGHVYITDFGLARIAQAGESTLSQDMLIGTPQYISPEQARGAPVDERSDIYSLGVVLFEMLTGRVPFSADTPYAVIHDHIYSPLPLPTSINPNLSADIERVLLKALAKDPEARFAGASELMAALEQAAGTTPPPPLFPIKEKVSPPPAKVPKPIITPPSPAPPVAPKPKPRLPARSCALVGIVALIVLVVCGALALSQRDTLARLLRPFLPPAVQQAEMLRIAKDKANANPQDPAAQVGLANAYANQKDYENAFAAYDRAIKLDPKNPTPYLRAAELAERRDDLERALRYYQAGHEALPEEERLLLGMGDVFATQKKWEEARAAYDKVLRLNPNSAQAIWRMGEYYRAQGKAAEALREYTRAITIDPNLPEAHYGLGMLAMQRGQNDEAKRQFQMVINNPNTPPDLKEQANKQMRLLDKK
jgi:serine/threonine protein kinase/TolA-binding protein